MQVDKQAQAIMLLTVALGKSAMRRRSRYPARNGASLPVGSRTMSYSRHGFSKGT